MKLHRSGQWLKLVLLLSAAMPCVAFADPGSEPAYVDETSVTLGFAEADTGKVAALVEQLNDYDYAVREQADGALRRLGPGAFAIMAEAYKHSEEFEPRVRIQRIARDQFLWHTLLKRYGFLGIEFGAGNHKSRSGVVSILISRVVSGSAADEAGLQANDEIFALDGEPLTEEAGEEDFPAIIQAKGAGGQVMLMVMRRGKILEIPVTLQARPIRHYADQRNPELLDELNRQLQSFSLWWDKHFGSTQEPRPRIPSHDLFELPAIDGPAGR